MSEKTFKLTVVSPDKLLAKDLEVTSVGARGTEGDFTALPGHLPFLTDLKPDVVRFRLPDGQVKEIFVSAGFVEVLPHEVIILADSCEVPGEIDEERAERARLRELNNLKQLHEKAIRLGFVEEGELLSIKKSEIKLHRAMARIKAAKKARAGG
ncbi:MAG: ATP synthase F1 subunit epsilon [Deltaproteobacteria bacterium]|jgi:F-type H+-transporting ATPase subunit epsilon|nr:ATP synthase F1 subunit epsilon [Deltaproteobacteria bacterium]